MAAAEDGVSLAHFAANISIAIPKRGVVESTCCLVIAMHPLKSSLLGQESTVGEEFVNSGGKVGNSGICGIVTASSGVPGAASDWLELISVHADAAVARIPS